MVQKALSVKYVLRRLPNVLVLVVTIAVRSYVGRAFRIMEEEEEEESLDKKCFRL